MEGSGGGIEICIRKASLHPRRYRRENNYHPKVRTSAGMRRSFDSRPVGHKTMSIALRCATWNNLQPVCFIQTPESPHP
jgi:hypothetical protein